MTPEGLLRTFHDQVRLRDADAGPDNVLEHVGPVRRNYSPDPAVGWSMIESPEGLGDDPDVAIAAQRLFFIQRGQRVEWKTYSYDQPEDLGERLTSAGFVRQDEEALMLGNLIDLISETRAPDGVTIRRADSAADRRRIGELGALIWGTSWQASDPEGHGGDPGSDGKPPEWHDPDELTLIAETSPDEPLVHAARVTPVRGTEFAGMWGGNTHPDWRRRGLYRTILSARARWALDRGYTFARVDASPNSEPILRSLGLHRVASTVPYVLDPSPRKATRDT